MAETTTKPKSIPIAAKETGPGPGRYALPATVGYQKHDFTKTMRPAYSFGVRLENPMFKAGFSPGPGYFINSSISRYGKDGTPSYTILGRQKDLNAFKTPAPGTYSPEKVHPQGERHAPAYSMGSRTRFRKSDTVPAPNSYSLPTMLGSRIATQRAAASYSMTGRAKTGSFAEDLAKTPGPCRYNPANPNLCKKKQPAYSMLGRSYMPGDSTKKPGPGAHRPEGVTTNKPKAPSFSLGIRHSEYITPLIIDVTD